MQEITVVLTKTMVSDQLGFVSVAKHWLTSADFRITTQTVTTNRTVTISATYGGVTKTFSLTVQP